MEQAKELFAEVVRTLKEPSDEDKEKKALEAERKKEQVRQAKLTAEQELNNRLAMQQRCAHRNERRHTFVAQVCGNGDAVALCQQCGRDYKWKATEDQVRQGINLIEFAHLTEQTLLAWEKQWPPAGEMPDRKKLLSRAGRPVT